MLHRGSVAELALEEVPQLPAFLHPRAMEWGVGALEPMVLFLCRAALQGRGRP